MKKVLLGVALVGGIMIESCLAAENVESFTNVTKSDVVVPWKNVSDVISFSQKAIDGQLNTNETNTISVILEKVINTTIKAFETINPPHETSIAQSDWRKAKLVEMIWTANNHFQDVDASMVCLRKLKDVVAGNYHSYNFYIYRYLLISQCNEWNEQEGKFKKITDADNNLIADATWKLRLATNGDTENSKKLLALLKNSGKFDEFLGDYIVK